MYYYHSGKIRLGGFDLCDLTVITYISFVNGPYLSVGERPLQAQVM